MTEFTTEDVAKHFRSTVGLANEEEMAVMLQVSHETLATWRTKRRGPPFIKLGKKAFYCIADFSKWITGEVERQSLPRTPRAPHRAGARPSMPSQVHIDENQPDVHVTY